MANLADSLLEVVDLPEGLHDLMDQPIDSKCICDLAEGHAPLRPRYIIPDYKKFMREGSKFLQLDPPKDLFEGVEFPSDLLQACSQRDEFPRISGCAG